MKHLFFFAFLLFVLPSDTVFAQDVWLQNHFSPNSGCNLSSSETVTVLVNNNSAVIMTSNTIQMYYSIDGGSPVYQPLSTNLTAGASWNFSFSAKADLSGCGPHRVKTWVARAGDVNHLNDTIVWTVQNDCTVTPGSITGGTGICSGKNTGLLSLTGKIYGSISIWQSSEDSGKTWTTILNNTDSLRYTDIKASTRYRVLIDGGYCPDDTSAEAELAAEILLRGALSGSDSLAAPASGTIRLRGASHPVLYWESTDSLGKAWTTISSTDTVLTYSGLTKTSYYRAITAGNLCPATESDTATITIKQLSSLLALNKGVNNIRIYPNPVSDRASISYNGSDNAGITVTDSRGQIVLETAVSPGNPDISTAALAPGLYYVFVRTTGFNGVASFIKQ